MKYIITLLLIVFSASVLNARSIKVYFNLNTAEDIMTFSITDSKTQDRKTHTILCDRTYLSVSKNKDTLKKLGDLLDDVSGRKMVHAWDKKDVIGVMELITHVEFEFITSDFQVTRADDDIVEKQYLYTFYFYKRD